MISMADPLLPFVKKSAVGKTTGKSTLNDRAQTAALATAHSSQNDTAEAPETGADVEARLSQSARTVRLNFLEASWRTVLDNYAQQVGANLVAEKKMIPPGRFTRRDRTLYTPGEALKIINRELMPFDLKLVGKAGHLVLVDLPSTRPSYGRPTLSGTRLVTDSSARLEQERAEREEKPTSRSRPPRQLSQVQTADAREVPISTDGEFRARGRVELASASEAVLDVDPSDRKVVTVPLKSRTVKDIANQLYKVFQKHAEVLNEGPDGMPVIRVFDPAFDQKRNMGKITLARPKRVVRFSLSLDYTDESIQIQAASGTARSLAGLIRKLDTPDFLDSYVQLVASERGDEIESIAQTVQEQVARLTRARNRAPRVEEGLAFQDDASQPQTRKSEGDSEDPLEETPPAANPRTGRRNAQDTDARKPELMELIGGLKGDVNVEALPDLGVLILRGNQKDVDAVMEIIKEIEKLSAGTAPDVNLRFLKNANSEALATLLTQVYERLSGRRPQATPNQTTSTVVSIIPVVKPNAVLIIAPKADMESILKLADELDQPVDPTAEFQMFRLKSAIAEQVLQHIQTFYEERQGLGTRVLAVADVRTNSVLVHARPRDLQEVAALVRELDQGGTDSVNQMKIIPLKNAVALELADVLQATLQSALNAPSTSTGGQGGRAGAIPGGAGAGGAGGASGAGLKDVKSTVLQFLASDGVGERLLRSGILADIRVTADGRTNSIVITAPEESMVMLEELVKQLDRPTSTVAAIKVFSLQNSDARSMVELLQQLFDTTGSGNTNGQTPRLGVQVADASDASSGLIPLKLSVDSRTNSIVAVGAEETLGVVEAVLIRLDESDVRQRQSIVFRLKNSPAQDVANAINNFLTSRSDLETSNDGLVSPFEQLEREVIVEPEPNSNSLLISATPRYFKEIKELVINLDSDPSQVIIQALLVEVTLDNTDEFGVELGLQDSVLFRRSVIASSGLTTLQTTSTLPNGTQTTSQNVISQTAVPGFLFNNQQLGNNTTVAPGIVGKQGLTSFSLGRQNGELGYGGLVLAAGSESVSVLLRALAATRRVEVLSRPQIRTLDNQLGVIQVGQEVPVVNGFSTTAFGVNPTVEIRQAGIILQVVPRISPDGRVVMDVAAERSQYLPEDQGVAIFSDATTGRTIRAPRKDISTARCSVAVSNEQTVVLGGMISSSNTNIQRKVPLLGDLPFLGIPFRYSFDQHVRKELLIFLTPRVIRNDADSEYIKQVEAARMHYMEQDAEEIHGPIMAAPPPSSDMQYELPPNSVPVQDGLTLPPTSVPGVQVPPPPPVSSEEPVRLMRRNSRESGSRPVALMSGEQPAPKRKK